MAYELLVCVYKLAVLFSFQYIVLIPFHPMNLEACWTNLSS